MQFFQDYKSEALNFSTLWSREAFKHAITIHPVKQPANVYSIHHYYKIREHIALQRDLQASEATIKALCAKLPAHLIPHSFINRTTFSCPSLKGNG